MIFRARENRVRSWWNLPRSSIIIYYHLLSSIIIYYHLLSSIIIYYHLLSSVITYYHLLSSIIIYYPMIGYIDIFPFIDSWCILHAFPIEIYKPLFSNGLITIPENMAIQSNFWRTLIQSISHLSILESTCKILHEPATSMGMVDPIVHLKANGVLYIKYDHMSIYTTIKQWVNHWGW